MSGAEVLLILLCVGLLGAILAGIPVAFALLGVPFVAAVIGAVAGVFDMAFVAAFPSRVFGLLTNPVLVSVPLFVFMGSLLERSDIARRMTLTAGALFGERRGGMAYAVIIVGALLAASTGVIAATIFMLGMIALPAMMRSGYANRLSAGVICASGSLGQIIPPSILLILLADQISAAYQSGRRSAGEWAVEPVSVGDIFAGAIVPGLLLVGLYLIYVVAVSMVKPASCPPIRISQIDGMGDRLTAGTVFHALVAPLLLIALVLGSILGGVATPTESAALGAVGAMLLVAANRTDNSHAVRRLYLAATGAALLLLVMHANAWIRTDGGLDATTAIAVVAALVLFTGVLVAVWRESRRGELFAAGKATATMVSAILIIVLGALALSLVFRGLGGEEIVADLLTAMPGGAFGALLAVMAVIFLLGFILEYVEIIFIVVPIACPPLFMADINPIWLAVLISMNLQMSFLTPPFGYALFYLRSVADRRLSTPDIYRGVIPFIAIQFIALMLIAWFPAIATWLPGLLYQ